VSGQSLKQLVAAQQAEFPVSGEINRTVADPERVIAYWPQNQSYLGEEQYLIIAQKTKGTSLSSETSRADA